ncbi:MAG: PEGA domain-containing protein, partial [Planctomycetes bacterium]|nr:PEGA domain-containing protein [Planctomycetota bacterium]
MLAEQNLTFTLIFGILLAFAVSCRPAAAAEGLVGGLYVESKPEGARVYIGGQLKGVTPCGIADVGIGEIQLKVMKEGRGTAHKTVTVKA